LAQPPPGRPGIGVMRRQAQNFDLRRREYAVSSCDAEGCDGCDVASDHPYQSGFQLEVVLDC
jgi:hypothetical protein